jgi:hypothetical protein
VSPPPCEVSSTIDVLSKERWMDLVASFSSQTLIYQLFSTAGSPFLAIVSLSAPASPFVVTSNLDLHWISDLASSSLICHPPFIPSTSARHSNVFLGISALSLCPPLHLVTVMRRSVPYNCLSPACSLCDVTFCCCCCCCSSSFLCISLCCCYLFIYFVGFCLPFIIWFVLVEETFLWCPLYTWLVPPAGGFCWKIFPIIRKWARKPSSAHLLPTAPKKAMNRAHRPSLSLEPRGWAA